MINIVYSIEWADNQDIILYKEYYGWYFHYIQIRIMLKKVFTIFLFLVLSSSRCKDSTQINGQCTQCDPTYSLVSGKCIQKTRGCLFYYSDSSCRQCQNGYVLSQDKCIRYASFYGIKTLEPAPIIPDSHQLLTAEDIENKLGKIYGPYFNKANEYLIRNHIQIEEGNIKDVAAFESKTGAVIRIDYLKGGSQYTGEVLISIYNEIKQIQFRKHTGNTGLTSLIQKISQTESQRLKQYILYDIKAEPQQYIIDYMDQMNTSVVRFASPRNINQQFNYQVYEIDFLGFSKEKILNIYPQLLGYDFEVRQAYGFTIFSAQDGQVSISLVFSDYRFHINNPNFLKQKTMNLNNYQLFNKYNDPRYLSSLDYLKTQFPHLKQAKVVKVRSAKVSGISFEIELLDTVRLNKYVMKVLHDNEASNQIIDGLKDGQTIYDLNYNYNTDQTFLKNYLRMASQSKVYNLPVITSVTRKILDQQIQYSVNYSPQQYLEFSVDLSTNRSNYSGYYIGGQNLNGRLSPFRNLAIRRQPEILINFMREQKTELATSKIKEIIYNEPYYRLTLVTANGTYEAIIEDKGQLIMISYSKVSEQTCFEFSVSSAKQDQTISAIDQFLKQYYQIKDYKFQSVQVRVYKSQYSYQYLYANSNLKQVEFILIENNKQVTVSSAYILNFGYQMLDEKQDNQLFRRLESALQLIDIGYNSILYSQKNNTHIRTYLSRQNDAIEAILNQQNMGIRITNTIHSKNYVLIPSGFSVSKLKIPTISGLQPKDAEIQEINQIVKQAQKKFRKFFDGAVVKYAQKDDEDQIYRILVQSNQGILRFEAQLSDSEQYTFKIMNVVLTNYQLSQLSNCLKFTQNLVCLECPGDDYFVYMGFCFKEMQGCLIQIGDKCAKCDTNYVRSSYRCQKQCELFFI